MSPWPDRLPSVFKVFFLGAGYGLFMRLLFGGLQLLNHAGSSRAGGVMLSAFVFLVPLMIGVIAVYSTPAEERGWVRSLWSPWLPTTVFVAGTALLLLEGSICIAMAMPIFLVLSSAGGLLTLLALRTLRPSPGSVSVLVALPLLIGYGETHLPLPQDSFTAQDSVWIAAPPEKIWPLITHARDIQPDELRGGVAYAIGVPFPVQGVTEVVDGQRVRRSTWQKQVRFDEPVTEWEENRYIRWRYAFQPDSFPAGALDDHVVIGGKYFDLIDTAYRLTPEGQGTRLAIQVRYRVSTNFNFYATAVARFLVNDTASSLLQLYKARGERQRV